MVTDIPPGTGLHVVRATSLDALADAFGALLAQPGPDPFAAQVVAVPGSGVQRWLAQRLGRTLGAGSGGDGICAGVEFPTLPALLARLSDEVAGVRPGEDPWRPSHVRWAILAELEALRDVEWAAIATRYATDGRPGARMAAADRLAGLFHRYANERPAMVRAWAQGLDVDAEGAPLDAIDAWQPRLWRQVRERLGGADTMAARRAVLEALEREAAGSLPERVLVLAPPRLGEGQREVLVALARTRQVVVGLVNHSPESGRWAPGARTAAVRGGHPLSTRLGRDALEQRDAWLAVADSDTVLDGPTAVGEPARPTVLAQLQRGVLTDDLPDEPSPASADGSLVLHSSHGPDRQVEVLRDVLLGLLADDETLEPRDVVVLCPQLDVMAPLIRAAFDPAGDPTGPASHLRVRVADRTLRDFNPVLGALSTALELAAGRMESKAVLDFARLAPVSARFGLSDDDHEALRRLVGSSGTRWGLDAAHRQEFGLRVPQNTWDAGLGRMLAGVAMTDEALAPLGMVLPLDDVGSGDVEAIGRLAELVDRLGALVRAARTSRPAAEWIALLRTALDGLVDARGDDAWQLTHAASGLTDLAESLGDGDVPLGLGDIRVALSDLMLGFPPRAGFGTGSLVVTSPDQLRHVRHRVVVLLGFDDAVHPRSATSDGDDLVVRAPRTGDHDARAADRQLLLDALMSATGAVHLVHAGADPITNEPVPLAVPITEVLDAVDRTVVLDDGARKALTLHHPLQPFSPDCFTGQLRSFDTAAARGAAALLRPTGPAPQRWPHVRLPEPERSPLLELGELVRTLDNPVAALLRSRGSLWIGSEEDDASLDEIPADLDGLGQWAIGERMLHLVRGGASLEDAKRAEWFRGQLPPRKRGEVALEAIARSVAAIVDVAHSDEQPVVHDIDVDVRGRHLRGTVTTVGGTITEVSYSSPKGKHLLRGWTRLLALQLAEPDQRWGWTMLGKKSPAILMAPPQGHVEPILNNLIELAEMATCEPVPFLPNLSHRYAVMRRDNPQQPLPKMWRELDQVPFSKEKAYPRDTDAAFRLFWPTQQDLSGQRPLESDCPGRLETSRFGTLARRVFQPLLNAQVQ